MEFMLEMGRDPASTRGSLMQPKKSLIGSESLCPREGLGKEIYRVLDEIHDPCSIARSVPMGLAEMGLIRSVELEPESGAVTVALRLTAPVCEMINYMRTEVIRRVGEIPGVECVNVEHDSGLDWDPDMMAPAAQRRRRRYLAKLQEVHERSTGG